MALTHIEPVNAADPDNFLSIGSHYDFNYLDRISIAFWFKHGYTIGDTTAQVEKIIVTNTSNLFKFISTNDDFNGLSSADFKYCETLTRNIYNSRKISSFW